MKHVTFRLNYNEYTHATNEILIRGTIQRGGSSHDFSFAMNNDSWKAEFGQQRRRLEDLLPDMPTSDLDQLAANATFKHYAMFNLERIIDLVQDEEDASPQISNVSTTCSCHDPGNQDRAD